MMAIAGGSLVAAMDADYGDSATWINGKVYYYDPVYGWY